MAPKNKSQISKASTPGRFEKEREKEFAKLPNWPPLAPLVPIFDLSLETLLDDQILVIRNFFTSTLCKSYIAYLSTLPLVTTPGKPKKGEAVRVNDRFQVDDASFSNLLWEKTALQELISQDGTDKWGGQVLGLNSNIRIYRYRPGHCFNQHYDESNRIFFGPDKIPAKTTWTLLIYLSICGGGETVFYPEGSGRKGEKAPDPLSVEPEAGLALLHRHGQECLLHEGKEVKSGEKWVLRSDLVVRR
jgi:hypothetical protein